MGTIITVIWAVLIALKIAAVGAIATTSWWVIIFWPVAALVLGFIIGATILGVLVVVTKA